MKTEIQSKRIAALKAKGFEIVGMIRCSEGIIYRMKRTVKPQPVHRA